MARDKELHRETGEALFIYRRCVVLRVLDVSQEDERVYDEEGDLVSICPAQFQSVTDVRMTLDIWDPV